MNGRLLKGLQIALLIILIFAGPEMAFTVEAGTGKISGRVLDERSGEGLAFANVLLTSLRDTTFARATISDIHGFFELSDIPPGPYRIQASYMGYNSYESAIELSARKMTVDVRLSRKSYQATGVEITAERQVQEQSLEKTTVNIAKNSTLTGGNAIDVMQSLPSVDFDVNGAISYRGSQRVTLLLNGKRSELVKSLDQIPAGQIERIEIINNPSAKYEADGMSGIINIILKKGSKNRQKTRVSLYGGLPENFGGNLGYSGFTEKGNFYVNGGYAHKTRFQTKEHMRINEAVETPDYYQYDRQDETLNNLMLSSGFDYSLGKRQQIAFDVSGSKNFNTADRSINYKTLEKSGECSYDAIKEIGIDLDNYSLDGALDYRYRFARKGQNIQASAHYNYFDQSHKMAHEIYPKSAPTERAFQNTNSEQLNKIGDLSVDYVHPFGDSLRLESGYHYSQSNLRNDFSSESYDAKRQEWQSDTALNNVFHYVQQIHAAYAEIDWKLKIIELRFGLRAEYTTNELLSKPKDDYLDFFPSLQISRKMSEHLLLFLSFNRRINRPVLKMINPYTNEYADILNMHIGNPDLKPEYVNSAEAGAQFFSEAVSGSVSVYYRNIDQAISRVKSASNDSALLVTFMNLDKAQLLGTELSLNIRPVKWWQIGANANIFHTNLKGAYDPNLIDRSHTAWTGNVSNSFKLPWKMGMQFTFYYRSELPDVMGTYLDRWYADFALNKKILKDKGQLIFKISDVFDTWRYGLDLTGTAESGYVYHQSNRRKNESQYFILSFVYNIAGKEKKEKKSDYFLEGFAK